MREYIQFESRLFLKNKRILFSFFFLLLFLVGMMVYIPYQKVNDLEYKTFNELELAKQAVGELNEYEAQEPENKEIYENLLLQQRAVASQDVALRFQQPDAYIKNGQKVSSLRLKGYEQGYGEVRPVFLISQEQARKDLAFYDYLSDHQLAAEKDAANGANYFTVSLTLFSSFAFFFFLFLSGDILTSDAAHATVVEAYPVNGTQRTVGKLLIHTLFPAGLVTLLFGIGYGLASLVLRPGILAYPEVIYQSSGYQAIPTWKFLLFFAGYLILLQIHVVLLSAVLNLLFKNFYLNLFLGGALYLLPILVPAPHRLFAYLPFDYWNPAAVLDGTAAVSYENPQITFSFGFIILSIWTLLYFLVVAFSTLRKNRAVPAGKEVPA